jgi:hypothetical protein
MSDPDFMDALKIRERYARDALTQAEIMEKAARALQRLQREMQEDMGRALAPFGSQRRPRNVHRLAWQAGCVCG